MLDQGLNVFFFVFHSVLILFNLLGWIWRKTRKANLVLLVLTVFSWFVLGIWYGFGYCPCTDWHWQVRYRLGYMDMSPSYLVLLIRTFTGLDVGKGLVDVFAVLFLLSSLAASITTNVRDLCRAKTRQAP